MKPILKLFAILIVALGASTAFGQSKSELVTDIENHSKKLRQVLQDENFDEVRKAAQNLREDIKALSRKADVSGRGENRLQAQVDRLVEQSQELENHARDENKSAARATFARMEQTINQITEISTSERRGGGGGGGADNARRSGGNENVDQLATDIRNHNVKLRKTIADRDFATVKHEAARLRDDVKAFARKIDLKSGTRQERLQEAEKDVERITENLQRQAEKEDVRALQAAYERLSEPVERILALRNRGNN